MYEKRKSETKIHVKFFFSYYFVQSYVVKVQSGVLCLYSGYKKI